MSDKILKIATEVQAIAQIGLAYCKDEFDEERYKRLMEISADLASLISDVNYESIIDLFSKEAGYATPKVGVRAAIFKDNRILLIKERSDNLWSIPGGWADVNLSPSENILKEVREETGYDAKVNRLIGVYKPNNPNSSWPYIYELFFICDIIGGSFKPSIETSEVLFFSLEELPELSRSRVTIELIEKCFLHYNNPNLPVDCD